MKVLRCKECQQVVYPTDDTDHTPERRSEVHTFSTDHVLGYEWLEVALPEKP